jgi:ubiquinone/menaquinone biosynthesis C-methylase UbiE
MSSKSAQFYDTLYAAKDYAGAAMFLNKIIEAHRPGSATLLDVACGTGRHLEHFQRWYRVEGVDINSTLLNLAACRCPGVPLHHQDMLQLDLERRFDVVTCLFSSIACLVTAEKLIRAISRMEAHLQPRGLLLIEPFYTPDQYWKDKLTANYSVSEAHTIAWMYVTAQQDAVAIADVHYLLGEGQQIEYFTERQEAALYSREDFANAFQKAGLAWTFQTNGPFGRGLYIAHRK